MLGSFMESFPGLESLLNAGVALLGLILTGMSIFKFIEFDKAGGAAAGRSLMTPAMYLLSGVALFNFASSIDTALETLWGPSTSVHNLMSYSGTAKASTEFNLMMRALIGVLQLYGYFTYARGWWTVRRIGTGQSGQDEVAKSALIRLLAGVALINIVGTVNTLSSTFGFGDVM